MKFDIYGRFELEVIREQDRWVAYRLAPGIRVREHDVVLPPEMDEEDLAGFLDDLFHELAKPGESVKLVGRSEGR